MYLGIAVILEIAWALSLKWITAPRICDESLYQLGPQGFSMNRAGKLHQIGFIFHEDALEVCLQYSLTPLYISYN